MADGDDLDDILDSALDDFALTEGAELTQEETQVTEKKEETEGKPKETAGEEPNEAALDEILEALDDLAKATAKTDEDAFPGGEEMNEEMLEKLTSDLTKQFENFGQLDNLVDELFSEDVLKEPMMQMREKYEVYLQNPPEGLEQADKVRYQSQKNCLDELCTLYESNSATSNKIMDLMQKMQEYGSPPDEIMKDLDLGGDEEAMNAELPQLSEEDMRNMEQCKMQ